MTGSTPVRHRLDRRRTAGNLLSLGLLAALVIGYGYILLAEPGRAGRAAQLVAPARPSSPALTAPASSSAASLPVRLGIPAIDVDSALGSIAGLPAATAPAAQPPARTDQASWYAGSALPGAVGAAVIGGLVDSGTGPAVFFRLRDLRIGDVVTVQRRDGVVLHFEVDGIHAYPTSPAASALTGPAGQSVLRLITLSATSSSAGSSTSGSYLQNLVVSAHLA